MSDLPLITLRVNSYNHIQYVEEAVMSVVNQTYPNKEIIVIDDGSTDGSTQLLEKLSKKYGFFYKTQENKGVSATLNDMLQNYTHGKYIMGTASDDILELDVAEKYVDYMEKHPEFGMCYGNIRKMNDNSEITGEVLGSGHTGDLFEAIATGKAVLPMTSFMWNTDVFKKVGYYEESIATEDIYMLYKVSKNFKIGYVNTFAKRYRVHRKNSTTNHWVMYENAKRVAQLYKNEYFYEEMIKLKHLQWFYLLSRNYKKEALQYFNDAVKQPLSKLFVGGLINLFGLGKLIDIKRYKN